LKALQTRKRELLLESELNRQLLRLDVARLSIEADKFRRGYGWARRAWILAAPLAGFLIARKRGKAAGAFAKGSLLFTALREGWKVWSTMREARTGPRTEK
jgi:hypothetical protein